MKLSVEMVVEKRKVVDDEDKEFIMKYQNLIYSIIVKRFKRFNNDIEDLFQAGAYGILKARSRYRAEEFNNEFSTFAYKYIFGEIFKEVNRNKNIRVSDENIKKAIAVSKTYDFLCQQLGRSPTDREISQFSEIDEREIAHIRNLETVSLDDDSSETSLHEFISIDEIPKDELLCLRDALASLERDEQELILKRYFYNKTQSEIAKEQETNQAKISRMEVKVLAKLRSYYGEVA